MGIQPQAIVRHQGLKLSLPGAEGQLIREAPGREQILQLPLARLVGARGQGGRLASRLAAAWADCQERCAAKVV